MLPPSAIAGVSLVCALGPWVFTQPMTLRLLAAAAAAVAVLGAVVMRHWDAQAGKQVADLTRARASDEWRFEERVAELESDLEESRELRLKLEHRLRAKRSSWPGCATSTRHCSGGTPRRRPAGRRSWRSAGCSRSRRRSRPAR